uniref:Uncharacterized protein n=1 Tax=Romanomermis culicivorax TaxID=13658 RepID=A0A915KPA4_ROMCU
MPTDSSSASSQSSKVPLALLALPSTSTAATISNLDARASNQPMSTANMVMPYKEIASATLIVSPRMGCNSSHRRRPLHICSSLCQIDNLTPSTKMFIKKYASTRAFQIPIKIGSINT